MVHDFFSCMLVCLPIEPLAEQRQQRSGLGLDLLSLQLSVILSSRDVFGELIGLVVFSVGNLMKATGRHRITCHIQIWVCGENHLNEGNLRIPNTGQRFGTAFWHSVLLCGKEKGHQVKGHRKGKSTESIRETWLGSERG